MATVSIELTTEQLELISDALDSHWQANVAARPATVAFGNFIDDLLEEAEFDDHLEFDGQPTWEQEWADFGESYE